MTQRTIDAPSKSTIDATAKLLKVTKLSSCKKARSTTSSMMTATLASVSAPRILARTTAMFARSDEEITFDVTRSVKLRTSYDVSHTVRTTTVLSGK